MIGIVLILMRPKVCIGAQQNDRRRSQETESQHVKTLVYCPLHIEIDYHNNSLASLYTGAQSLLEVTLSRLEASEITSLNLIRGLELLFLARAVHHRSPRPCKRA
jgi:hypothetical protein